MQDRPAFRLFDTHCHLYHDRLAPDLDAVLLRCQEAGVTDIALPAIDFDTQPLVEELRAICPSAIRLYPMAGIHPTDVPADGVDFGKLEAWAHEPEVVGIGETGLDYYWSRDLVDRQQESLRFHCRLARETGKPIILHVRDSTDDVLRIIREEQDGRLRGIWHCYTGTLDQGLMAVDLNLHLGIGGVLTYPKGGISEWVHALPADRLLLETDAPFLAPVPHRGKRNEPAYVRAVAEKLALLLNRSLEETAALTAANADSLFGA